MKAKKQTKLSNPTTHLPILDLEVNSASPAHAPETLNHLQALMQSIAIASGLDVCIFPTPRQCISSNLRQLPNAYLSHRSHFCLAAKQTHDGRGCREHDSILTNTKAATIGKPFVQICHRGVAEVIVPICKDNEHLATIFVGQAVTPEIEARGFDAIWNSAQNQVTSRKQLRRGFEALPRISEKRLLHIGILADAALHGLVERLSTENLIAQIRLQSSPAIRLAIDILHQQQRWDISLQAMAKQVHLSPAYFSRLFHRIMGQTYSDYLNHLRMAVSKKLLLQPMTSIAQVSEQCGFSRQSYFTQRFRSEYGITPSEFRAKSLSGELPCR